MHEVFFHHDLSAAYGGFSKQGKLPPEPKMQNSSEPRPCKRFSKRIPLNAKFLA
jgi:hypothetical protein